MALLKADWIVDRFFENDADAEIYISFRGAKGRVDELRAKFAAKAPDAPKTREELNAKLDALWGNWYELFYTRYNYFSDDKAGFAARLRKLSPQWLQEHRADYPTLAENATWLFSRAGKNLGNLENSVIHDREDAQRKRKLAWVMFSGERRRAVETELKAKKYRELKDAN